MSEQSRSSVSFSDLLHYYLHQLWIIITASIVFAVGSFIITKFAITPKYTATSSILVLTKENDQSLLPSDMQISGELLNDYKVLIKTKNITSKVIDELDLDMTTDDLASMLEITSPPKTRILEIHVTSSDPVLATNIANTIWQIAATQFKELMDVENVKLVEDAETPASPSSPNVAVNTIIGFLIGLVLSIIILTFVFVFDDKITKPEAVKFYLDLNTLAEIPYVKELDENANKHTHLNLKK